MALVPGTNQAFLRDVIRAPIFHKVLITRFILETFLGGWGSLVGFRIGACAGLLAQCRIQVQAPGGEPVTLDVVETPGGPRAMLDGVVLDDPRAALSLQVGDGSVQVASDGASSAIAAMPLVQARGRRTLRKAASGSDVVAAMPGLVAKLLV